MYVSIYDFYLNSNKKEALFSFTTRMACPCQSVKLILCSCRVHAKCCAQGINSSVLLVNSHVMMDVPKAILFQPVDPRFPPEKHTKPYILEHLDGIKHFLPQYILLILLSNIVCASKVCFPWQTLLTDSVNN